MKRKTKITITQILAIIAVILILITSCLIMRLCATIDAYKAALSQSQYNIHGNSVNVYIDSEETADNKTSAISNLFGEIIKAFVSTIVSALFSAITVKIVFVKKDKEKATATLSIETNGKEKSKDAELDGTVTIEETKSETITSTEDEIVKITKLKTITKTIKKRK